MQTIKLVKGVKGNFRPNTARAEYYAAILNYNGQSVATYSAAMLANPPKLPKSGKVEQPSGWVSFFVRKGYITLS